MKNIFLIIALVFILIEKTEAQNQCYNQSIPDTFYYPFKDGIQMIEINYYNEILINHNIYSYAKNTYIFRNTKGEIINIYNQKENKIDFSSLKSPKSKVYTEDFLLYQYMFTTYTDSISGILHKLFVYETKEGFVGFFNEKGAVIIQPQYEHIFMNGPLIGIEEPRDLRKKYKFYTGFLYLNNGIINPINEYFFYKRQLNSYRSFYVAQLNDLDIIINKESKKILFSSIKEIDRSYIRIPSGIRLRYEDSNQKPLQMSLEIRPKNLLQYPKKFESFEDFEQSLREQHKQSLEQLYQLPPE